METIPGSFRKQAMSDTVPLSLLFKCSPGFRSLTAQSLYLVRSSNGEEVTDITSEGTSKPSNIFSSHEEADTKMIFNAIDANIMFEKSHEKGQIIIRSADTDVLILNWHFIITSKCIGPYTY